MSTKPYREHEGSTFTHLGKLYSLNKMLELTEHLPTVQVKVKDLAWIVNGKLSDDDEKRIEEADTSAPIIVLPNGYMGMTVTLDGYHRLVKAIRLGDKELPAKVATPEMLQQAHEALIRVPKKPAYTRW